MFLLNIMGLIYILLGFVMPPPKSALAKQLAKGREVLAEKQAALTSESANSDLWDKLQAANSHIEKLELELNQKNLECTTLHSDLEKSNQRNAQLMEDISHWKSKHKDTYHQLRMQRQATNRGHDKVDWLKQQIVILKKAEKEASARHLSGSKQSEQALDLLKKENEGVHSELSRSMARWSSQLDKSRSKLEALMPVSQLCESRFSAYIKLWLVQMMSESVQLLQ